jgi:hypothetical protein
MRCKKPDNTYTTVSMLYFYPVCGAIQQALGICSTKAGAWVAAVTVCNQRLF